jgi:hypothetical protein
MLQDNLLRTNIEKTDFCDLGSSLNYQHETRTLEESFRTIKSQPENVDKTFYQSNCNTGLKYRKKNYISRPSSKAEPRRKKVSGTVRQIDEEAIICEIELKPSNFMNIRLPNSIFTDKIFIGFPFFLEIDNSSGFKTPRITKRALSEDFMNKNLTDLDTLISEL